MTPRLVILKKPNLPGKTKTQVLISVLALLVGLPPFLPVAFSQESATPWNRIATSLAAQAGNNTSTPIRVGVLEFLFEDTEVTSPFSTFLRGELEKSLVKTKRFTAITRSRLADLQLEGKFQASSVAKPGTSRKKVSIEGVDAMVRGRFFSKAGKVTVQAELVWLDGGRVVRSSEIIEEASIPVAILPKTGKAGMAGLGAKGRLPTVGVLYFENASKQDKDLEGLAAGLLGMMITGLGETGRYNVVERERIDEVLKELKLTESDKVDSETGAKIGKLLGAQYLVYGTTLYAFGQYRVDARMVQVETGAIISTGSGTGTAEKVLELASSLSAKISAGDKINPKPAPTAAKP